MKRKYILLAPFILVFCKSPAQTVDIYGLHAWARQIPAYDHGFGGGMTYMGSPLRLSKKRAPLFVNGQFGGGMFACGLGQRTFKDVPLLTPPEGDARVLVRNSFIGINLSARLTFPDRRSEWVPYAEISGYYRGMMSRMFVTPNKHKKGYEYSSDSTIVSLDAMAWGLAGGVLKNLGDGGYLDIGFIWSTSAVPGSFMDLRSVKKESDGLSMHITKAPVDLFILKVGFVILIEDGNFRRHYTPPASSHSCSGHTGNWHWGGGGGGSSNTVKISFK